MGAADNFFQKAEQALKKRNYDYAIELWQQGLAIDPDRIEERKKLRATAIRRCQDTGKSTTGGGMLKIRNAGLLGRVKKFGALKKWEEQIVEIEKYLALAPQDAKALMVHADAFERTDRTDSALQIYREVAEVDPTNADAFKRMGRIYEARKEVDRAVECWERVRAIDPSDSEAGKAIRDLSAAQMMRKTEERRSAGDGSFRDLLKDTDESDKLEKKQQIIRTADDARGAIDIKRAEVEADAENPRMWRELGDIYTKANQYDDARAAYEKAISLKPDDMYLKERLGNLQEAQFLHELEEKRIAAKKAPGDAAAQEALARAETTHNEFMLTEYERRVAAHPTDYGLKYKFGKHLQDNDRYDEAIAQFQNARKDPKFATESCYRIGQCFFSKKVFGPSVSMYREALSSVAEKYSDLHKDITYDLAMALDAQNKREEALELLEGIMVVDINYRDVSQKVDELRS